MSLSWGFDPAAFAMALVAILVTLREVKRNNTVIFSILECSKHGRSSEGENNGQRFDHLLVLVRNVGVPIHDPAMSLNFTGRDGFGRFNIQLHKKNERTGDHDELSKGMIAEFGFKSYELDATATGMLMELEDPAKQDACLFIFSQGYLAKQLRVGGLRDRVASKWNSLASRINRLFRRPAVTSKGKPGLNTFNLFPTLRTLDSPVMGFVESIRREHQQARTSGDSESRLVRT
jgi:hypothetical protein